MKNSERRFLWLMLGVSIFAAGCAWNRGDSVGTGISNSAPLRQGESVSIDFISRTSVGCFGPPSYHIDPQGLVQLGSKQLEIAGLSPTEAASKIQATFAYQFFDLEVRVSRVQPNGAANRSQPDRSETNPTPSAAGSGR